MGTFCGYKAIVGGNETAYDSNKTGCATVLVNAAGIPGYLTAG